MQIRTSVVGGSAIVEVIDPSDHAVTHRVPLDEGQQVVVTATTASSPADLEVGEAEAIPEAPEAEDAPTPPEGTEPEPEPPAPEGSAEQAEAANTGDPIPGDGDQDAQPGSGGEQPDQGTE